MSSEVKDYGYIECRRYGHAWSAELLAPIDRDGNPTGVSGKKQAGWCDDVKCLRCDTSRKTDLDRRFELERRTYHYPEGYLLSKGHARVSRSEWHAEHARRAS